VLPGRRNIVVTRDAGRRFDGCDTVPGLCEALEVAARDEAKEVFLIGGAELFRKGWELAQKLVLTEIDADFEGDISIDAPDPAVWKEISREKHRAGAPNDFDYSFVTYERRPG